MTISIETISDRGRLAAIAGAWNALWTVSRADIFLRHEWLDAWCSGIAGRSEIAPLINVAWQDGRLIAALPFAVSRRHGIRSLEWAAQTLSDYCDAMTDASTDGLEALGRLWAHTMSNGGFDLMLLRQVRPDAKIRQVMGSDRRAVLEVRDRTEPCYHIQRAWSDGEEYFRTLNKKARNNHTRGKRILTEIGGSADFIVRDAGSVTVADIEAIRALKMAWLTNYHPDSPLLNGDESLLQAVLEAAAKTGLMQLFLIESGGTLAAASINFVYPTKMQAYLTAYDPAFERASPGTILIVEYTKWAFDKGLEQVDFLRGDEPFKLRLANGEVRLEEFLGYRTFKGRLAIAARQFQQHLRRSPSPQPAEQTKELA